MKGTVDIDKLTDNSTSKFLFEIFKTSKTELNINITQEKIIYKYKRLDERTATSSSGRYLRPFHALFKPFKFKDVGDKISIEEKREPIIQVHFMMLQIAAIHSHVYKWWTNILTCMIKKDPGSAKIHRLRVIHLCECNLNLLLRLFMHEMDQHCEGKHLINKGTYGGQANRRSSNPVIVNVTQVEIATITHRILVRFNNDITACFDWIIHHVLCLCL